MDTLDSLQAELSILEFERTWIEGQGCIRDCWIAAYRPGGTARGGEKSYWQLRSSKPMIDGRRSKHLKAAELAEYQAQVFRGRRSRQLERQIAGLQKRILRVEKKAL